MRLFLGTFAAAWMVLWFVFIAAHTKEQITQPGRMNGIFFAASLFALLIATVVWAVAS
jgi:hypothetical protein